ncbi:MAG: hypothetical protein ABIO49_17130 [Dokdonella sp.]
MKSTWDTWLPVALATTTAVCSIALMGSNANIAAAATQTPTYLGAFPHFNPTLSTDLPGDVDVAIKEHLENQKKFAEVQRLFDLWSWQAFVTLNWPTNNKGEFAPQLSDTAFGNPDWTLWHESTDIFRQDGGVPAVCNKPTNAKMLSLTRDTSAPVARDLKAFQVPAGFDKRRVRLLGNITAVGERSPATPAHAKTGNDLNDILQAFTSPLIDQNGNYVFYEILLDPNEVSYLCTHKLYNINGQVAFSEGGKVSADLPRGVDTQNGSGAWETKFAWRVLTAKDKTERFVNLPAIVPVVNGKCPDQTAPPSGQCNVTVGLVGMHIGHKSTTSPQWIWSTFEQVDNLSVNNVDHPELSPSFFDPNCPICVPNQPPARQGDNWATSPKTQAARAIPIPADKIALNDLAAVALHKANSVLQYYQLIDTQWPTDPTAKPTPASAGLPGAVENKPGGNPTPVFLTNIAMETYFQHGVQAACNAEELPGNVACPAGQWLAGSQKAAPLGDETSIFNSESCMGCHSSAGLYTSLSGSQSGQLTGDFSWLFTQKAHLAKSSK